MAASSSKPLSPVFGRLRDQGDLYVVAALLAFLAIMIFPLPPAAMDMLLALSISGSLLIFLVTIYVVDPVEFSVFPTILLGATLFRLSLNVASTRLILLSGEEIGRGRVVPRQYLAIDPGDARGKLRGMATKDPVFGLDAVWIPDGERLRAQQLGYTVVDVPTVVTTHLTELLHTHGHELFGRAQLAQVLDQVSAENPRLVEELIPDPLPRSAVLRVFRNLLREGVSVRDAQTILEAMADHAHRVRDPDVLTEFVRQRLARHITHRYAGEDGVIRYIGLEPDAEDALSSGLHSGDGGSVSLSLAPDIARRLLTGIRDAAESWQGPGEVVLLCPPLVRGPLRRLTEKIAPRVPVISPAELLPDVRLERVASVGLRRDGEMAS